MLEQIVFTIAFVSAIAFFIYRLSRIYRYIKSAKPLKLTGGRKRLARIFRIAIGHSKLFKNPLVGFLHAIVFWGFIIVNIEMLEIIFDGIFGTHRSLAFLGNGYTILLSLFEIFAFAVIIASVVFLARRNIVKIRRFWNREMTTWPRTDATIILVTEILLMASILVMNASDIALQAKGHAHYPAVGTFLVSGLMQPWFAGMSEANLIFLERFAWWFHIIGVLLFMNYITFSKHLHIFFSFFNVYFSKLAPLGKMRNMPDINREVKLMLNPGAGNSAPPAEDTRFGAKDATDLHWPNLLGAFSCTECGRCTAACPAHITGKKLSPRKIVMDLRDRVENSGAAILKQGKAFDDKKDLFSHITHQELWACTTCNACVEECPVNIDPLAVILEMRRFLVLEQGSAPGPLNAMFSNIENNGAPWQYAADDRTNWTENLSFKKQQS